MAGVYGGMKRICLLCGAPIRVDNPGLVLNSPDWANGRPVEVHRRCTYAAVLLAAILLRRGGDEVGGSSLDACGAGVLRGAATGVDLGGVGVVVS